jgi:hypothetical protein
MFSMEGCLLALAMCLLSPNSVLASFTECGVGSGQRRGDEETLLVLQLERVSLAFLLDWYEDILPGGFSNGMRAVMPHDFNRDSSQEEKHEEH